MQIVRSCFWGLILAGLPLVVVASEAGSSAAGENLSWSSFENGGTRSTGGDFEVVASVGQPEVAALSGGDFELVGGFWSALAQESCASEATIFCDGFESGDFSGWPVFVGSRSPEEEGR